MRLLPIGRAALAVASFLLPAIAHGQSFVVNSSSQVRDLSILNVDIGSGATAAGRVLAANGTGGATWQLIGSLFTESDPLSLHLTGGTVTGATSFTGGLTANDLTVGSTTMASITRIRSNIAAGTYIAAVTGASGAARDILQVGQGGYSNGFQVQYDGSTMLYTFNDGPVAIPNVGASKVVTTDGSSRLTGLTALTAALGGTGQTSYTTGDLLYASSSSALSKLPGAAGVLKGAVGGAPSWGAVDLGTAEATGTIADARLPNVATAGTYAYPSSVVIDAKGRTTSITAGSAPLFSEADTLDDVSDRDSVTDQTLTAGGYHINAEDGVTLAGAFTHTGTAGALNLINYEGALGTVIGNDNASDITFVTNQLSRWFITSDGKLISPAQNDIGESGNPIGDVWTSDADVGGTLDVESTATFGSGSANEVMVAGGAAANPVTVTATGSDANVDISLVPKGTGTTRTPKLRLSGTGLQSLNVLGTDASGNLQAGTALQMEADTLDSVADRNNVTDQSLSTGSNLNLQVSGTTRGVARADASGNAVFSGTGTGATYIGFDGGTGGINFGNGAFGINASLTAAGVYTLGSLTSPARQVILSNAAGGSYASTVISAGGAARDVALFGVSGVSNGLTVQYTGTEMRYNFNDGKVGIGDITPAYALTVGVGDLFGVNSNGQALLPAGSVGAPALTFTSDTDTGLYSGGNGVLKFAINSGDVGQLDTTGAKFGYLGASKVVVTDSSSYLQGLSALTAPLGGTGQTSYTTGDILYASSSSALSKLNGAAGFLKSTGASAPSWSAINLNSSDTTGQLPATKGGTGISSYANGDLLVGVSPSTLTKLTAANGVLKGTSGGTVSWGAVDLASADVTGLLPWANVNKTGSSLSDLASRTLSMISDVTITASEVNSFDPTGRSSGTVPTANGSGGITWTAAGVTGSGTIGKLPKWASSSSLGDSIVTEASNELYVSGNFGVQTTNPAYSVHALGGGMRMQALATPSAPTVTPVGTTESTTYFYYVVAKDAQGNRSPLSAFTQITNGNDTLDGTNYNQITWTAVPGAVSYDILKTNDLTRLATVTAPTVTVNDTGQATSAYVPPTRNETGDFTVDGLTTTASAKVTGLTAGAADGIIAVDSSGNVRKVASFVGLSYDSATNTLTASGVGAESDPNALHRSGGSNTMSQSILFGSNNAYDIGSSTNKVRDIYATNFMGSLGIFSGSVSSVIHFEAPTFFVGIPGSGNAAGITSGTGGSPEGVISASPGSIYLNMSGGSGTTLFVKESGTGNTGWVAK